MLFYLRRSHFIRRFGEGKFVREFIRSLIRWFGGRLTFELILPKFRAMIKRFIFLILLNAGVLWGLEHHLFPDTFAVSGGVPGYVFVSVVFGFMNAIVKPILKILTFPFKILTLGLFAIILNGFMLWALQYLVNFLHFSEIAISIDGWLTYILAGVSLALANSVFGWFLK